MKFNILFTVLKFISILVKLLSYIYVETLPRVISYVSNGVLFVLSCILFLYLFAGGWKGKHLTSI